MPDRTLTDADVAAIRERGDNVMEAAREYEGDRAYNVYGYDAASLRAAFRHGYDHADVPALLAALTEARARAERMRKALEFIAGQENLTFAECTVAEEIVSRARAALSQPPAQEDHNA